MWNIQVFETAQIARRLELGCTVHIALTAQAPKSVLIAKNIETGRTLGTVMTVMTLMTEMTVMTAITVITMRSHRSERTARTARTVQMTCFTWIMQKKRTSKKS